MTSKSPVPKLSTTATSKITPAPASAPVVPVAASAAGPNTELTELSTPQDLGVFVESMLSQLQSRFEDMSSQIVSKMDEMGSRIDELEKSIGDLMAQTNVEENTENNE